MSKISAGRRFSPSAENLESRNAPSVFLAAHAGHHQHRQAHAEHHANRASFHGARPLDDTGSPTDPSGWSGQTIILTPAPPVVDPTQPPPPGTLPA